MLLTASCDYFDITRDKDGNKITLISIDLPEFDESYSIRVRELWLNTNPSRPVYVELSGQSVEDDKIITDLGYLKRSFVLDQEKRLFLYLNPNFKVTEQDPVEFTLSGMNSDCLILP